MCGIGGIMRVWKAEQRVEALRTPPSRAIPERWLDVLDDAVKHRGPDGQGRFRDRVVRADGRVVDVAFVHRRLSIIDHAGGQQPMVVQLPQGAPSASSGADGRAGFAPARLLSVEERDAHTRRVSDESIWAAQPELALAALSESHRIAVVFNGCIYNHRELRKELQAAGHVFGTDHSDTEVLVHGWREWGEELHGRLEGMFVLVLWDSSQGRVVSMRDRFGEKPLYRGTLGGVRAFSSTAAGLARLERLANLDTGDGDLEEGATRAWVQFGWNQVGPYSRFRSALIDSTGDLGEEKIVDVGVWSNLMKPGRGALTADQVDGALRRAVHARLEADVPVGCFLSGGVDSALISKYAAEVRPDLRCYTVRMPAEAYDESAMAAVTAQVLGVSHEVLECNARPSEDLETLVQQLGLPFGDSSLLPTTWVSRAARREVNAALSGDGGDEMFLGYDRHAAMPWLRRLERLPAAALESLVALAPTGGMRSKRARAVRLLNAARYGGYKDLLAIFPPPLTWMLGIARPGEVGFGAVPHSGMVALADDRGGSDEWSMLALRFDRGFYLPEDLLRKADTASMSVALETRAPMLDGEVARLAMGASIDALMPRGRRKGLLRAVARRYLPAEIVDRPKMGFAIPIGDWFRSDYGGLRTMLLDHLNSTEPFGPPSLGIDLNMACVRQMLDEHLGTGVSGVVKRDHGQRLYMLLVLSIWAKWLRGLGSDGAIK